MECLASGVWRLASLEGGEGSDGVSWACLRQVVRVWESVWERVGACVGVYCSVCGSRLRNETR